MILFNAMYYHAKIRNSSWAVPEKKSKYPNFLIINPSKSPNQDLLKVPAVSLFLIYLPPTSSKITEKLISSLNDIKKQIDWPHWPQMGLLLGTLSGKPELQNSKTSQNPIKMGDFEHLVRVSGGGGEVNGHFIL